MIRWSLPAGGVPYSKRAISRSVPQMPTSSMRSFTCVGDSIDGAGASISRTFLSFGKTAIAFIDGLLATRRRCASRAG
jgi:hypothetical protein